MRCKCTRDLVVRQHRPALIDGFDHYSFVVCRSAAKSCSACMESSPSMAPPSEPIWVAVRYDSSQAVATSTHA